jgi:chemotaxis protein methyltransferase CheR
MGSGHDDVLARIERRLGAHAGLKMPAWLLSSRVSERMRALGLSSMEEYVRRLDSRLELDALSEALRVGETSFFRHKAHMGALRRIVAPDLAARHVEDRRVRVWSAGCASGEEPYTLAMVLAEAMPPERGWRIEVLATDISEEALEVARRGRYGEGALKAVPTSLRERWFRRVADGAQIVDELARMVRLERKNLVDVHWGVRGMDVILCRNVLIYFDPGAQRRTANRLIEALAPGGYLFLGYAESLREFDTLEALRSDDGVVYRRPLKGKLPVAEVGTTAPPVLPAPAPSAPAARTTARAVVTVRLSGSHESSAAVAELLRVAISTATEKVVVDLDGADYLSDAIVPALRRAATTATAAGLGFELRASRPGPRRFLSRHGLGGPP